MPDISWGLTLSSEEHEPAKLVDLAVQAETAGFDFVSISDHYHPWVGEQGHSPFVWSVLGAIAQATTSLRVAVGVTCPTVRMHPAVVAHAVATTACLLEDRFTWGVGTGEHLNEHVIGAPWPPAPQRLEMLDEAVCVIRDLLDGGSVSHRGRYYTVEDARLFDRPTSAPPIVFSAFGTEAAKLAAARGDGLWITGIDEEVIDLYRSEGGTGPVYSQLSICWDPSPEAARERAHRLWPNTGLPGQLAQDLRTVLHFEQATELVTVEHVADSIPCGPDIGPILDSARAAADAGVDHIYFHQIGDPSAGFIDLWTDELHGRLTAEVGAR